jgi:hypothetical protein
VTKHTLILFYFFNPFIWLWLIVIITFVLSSFFFFTSASASLFAFAFCVCILCSRRYSCSRSFGRCWCKRVLVGLKKCDSGCDEPGFSLRPARLTSREAWRSAVYISSRALFTPSLLSLVFFNILCYISEL